MDPACRRGQTPDIHRRERSVLRDAIHSDERSLCMSKFASTYATDPPELAAGWPVKVILVTLVRHPTSAESAFRRLERVLQRPQEEEGSLWDDALAKEERWLSMEQFAKSRRVWPTRWSSIHTPSRRCADRVLINVSPLMRAADTRHNGSWTGPCRQMNA